MARILLVEDNQENREALSRRLQRRGFDVVTAEDGQAAVNLAKTEKPDVVLMDMNMPVLDGWQATQMIKADPESANLPILALTAHAMAGDKEKALQAGCTDYHTKPVDFPRLLEQIEALIKGQAPVTP
jgi:two-component system cell cycle response regulator DivK